MLRSSWCIGTQSDQYPTHGILRRVALIHAIAGERNNDNQALGRLRNLNPISKGSKVLGVIQLATYAEVAALTWEKANAEARELLDCTKRERLGLKQLLAEMSDSSRELFPSVSKLSDEWLEVLNQILPQDSSMINPKDLLLGLGRKIGY